MAASLCLDKGCATVSPRGCRTHSDPASQVTPPSDDRSPIAKAYGWATRIIVVSFEMVLPGLLGYWVDRQWGTVPLLMVLGMAVGFTGGMWHLMRMIAQERDHPDSRT